MDELLLSFVRENFVSIGLVLAILKVIALETPWAGDDKILEVFTKFFDRDKS